MYSEVVWPIVGGVERKNEFLITPQFHLIMYDVKKLNKNTKIMNHYSAPSSTSLKNSIKSFASLFVFSTATLAPSCGANGSLNLDIVRICCVFNYSDDKYYLYGIITL